jgi:hypothetical protein
MPLERLRSAQDKLDPLFVKNLPVFPDGLGTMYTDDPEIVPSITISVTVNVPLAVTPPAASVKPPNPPRSLIAPTFNCAILLYYCS